MVGSNFVLEKALLVLIVVLVILWRVHGEDKRVPLRILGLFPYNGSAWDGEYVIPAARLARNEINNDISILPDYKLKLIERDSRCSRDPGLREFVSNTVHLNYLGKESPIAVLGAGCSSSSIQIASVAGRDEIRIPQLSYGATSVFLSFKHSYPYFYRTVPTDSFTTIAKVKLMKKFNWKRFGIHNAGVGDSNQIVTEHAITTLRVETAKHIPDAVEVYTGDSRNVIDGEYLKNQLAFTQDMNDARMRVGMLYGAQQNIAKFFCFLFREKLTYPRVVWVVSNQGGNWYNTATDNCSAEEIRQATRGTIHFDYELMTNSTEDVISVTNKTYEQYYKDYISQVNEYAIEFNHSDNASSLSNPWNTVAYDSMWTLGLALDRAEKSLNKINLTLRDSNNPVVSSTILNELKGVVFNGASGRIKFDRERKREMGILIHQVQNGSLVYIGKCLPSDDVENLGDLSLNKSALLWPVDDPPLDDFTTETVVAHSWAGILMLIFLVIGFIWNSFSLLINFLYQHFQSIKASSPPLNYLIFAGNYILLLSGIVIVIKSIREHDIVPFTTLCRTRNWLFDVGLLLVLNTTLLKSWRIYRIFHSFKQKPSKWITDGVFITISFIMIVLNTLYRLVYVLVDNRVVVKEKVLPLEGQVRQRVIYCSTLEAWGILSIPHYVIAIALCLLAFSIRKIKHKQYNDAANIAIFFYTTAPVATVCFTLSFVLSPANNVYDLATPSLIFDCITVCCIVYTCQVTLFVPKMLPLFRQWRSQYCHR